MADAGPGCSSSLDRLGDRADHRTNVAGVREREALRSQPPVLAGKRVVLGESGGLDVLVHAIDRILHDAGAVVALLHHPHHSVQAVEANDFQADVYLGFSLVDGPACEAAFYATTGWESPGGRRLASLLVESWSTIEDLDIDPARGRWLPILRETRMPAVACGLGPPSSVVTRTAALASATSQALAAWVETPIEA